MGQGYGLVPNAIKLLVSWRRSSLITARGVGLLSGRQRVVRSWVWFYYIIVLVSEKNYLLLLQYGSGE